MNLLSGPEQKEGIKFVSERNKGTMFHFSIIEQPPLEQEPIQPSPIQTGSNYLLNIDELSPNQSHTHLLINSFPTESVDLFVRARGSDTSKLPAKESFSPELRSKRTKSFEKFNNTRINHKPRILVVDDDIFNISAIEFILSKFDQTCDKAFNGEQAISKVVERQLDPDTEQYEIIFMDYNMPIMNGFDATRVLKAKIEKGEISKIPIVACTAVLNEKEMQLISEIGFDDSCQKPISKDKIEKIVNKFFSEI